LDTTLFLSALSGFHKNMILTNSTKQRKVSMKL